MKNKLELLQKIELIKNQGIQQFVYHALEKANMNFWTAPCSSTGKYHPPEDQGKGGLVRHVIKCVPLASHLSDYYQLTELEKDITLASVFLHDIKKNGEPWKETTDYTHGLIAYNFLEQFRLENKNIKEIIKNAVRYHMWRWCQPESEVKRAMRPTKIENIVQLVDFFTSRKDISYMPDVPAQGFKYEEEKK